MARPGVTYEDVEKACKKIITDGGKPSINSVKAVLGGGSPNNISALLRKWKEATQPEKKSERVLPDAVILSITNEIERCVTEEKEILEQRSSTLQGDQDRLIQHCDELDVSIREEKNKSATAHAELQAAVASCKEKDNLIKVLRAEIEQEQRKTEDQRLIVENQRIDLAKATMTLEILEQQAAQLPQLVKACSDAEKKAEISATKETAVREAFSRLEIEITLLSKSLNRRDSEVREVQTKLAESKVESSTLQVENAVMQERLAVIAKGAENTK